MTPTNGRRGWGARLVRVLPGRFRAELAYQHALDDVWDALDDINPCHDRVRDWISQRRQEVPRV